MCQVLFYAVGLQHEQNGQNFLPLRVYILMGEKTKSKWISKQNILYISCW